MRLRPWVEADAAALHAGFGDPETMRYWNSPVWADLAETTERIRRSCLADPTMHQAYAVVMRSNRDVIGMVNYHDRHVAFRRTAIGWMLIPAARGQGFAKEAVSALVRHCFMALDINRIEARIEPLNSASRRLGEALGFRAEGMMREWLVIDGQPRDSVLFALLHAEWISRTGGADALP